jgi:hypothetical protein
MTPVNSTQAKSARSGTGSVLLLALVLFLAAVPLALYCLDTLVVLALADAAEDARERVEARSIHDHVSSLSAATIVIFRRAQLPPRHVPMQNPQEQPQEVTPVCQVHVSSRMQRK